MKRRIIQSAAFSTKRLPSAALCCVTLLLNDQASSELVAEFYRQLQDPAVSRAVALQRAQLKLLGDQRYQHPGYWAPFLLLNNWL